MVRFSGERLRRVRESAGMTQEQLAEAIGVSRNQISAWENEYRPLGHMDLAALAEVLKAPVSAFFEGESTSLTEAERAELQAILSRASAEQRRMFLKMLRAAVGFRLPDEEVALLPAAS